MIISSCLIDALPLVMYKMITCYLLFNTCGYRNVAFYKAEKATVIALIATVNTICTRT